MKMDYGGTTLPSEPTIDDGDDVSCYLLLVCLSTPLKHIRWKVEKHSALPIYEVCDARAKKKSQTFLDAPANFH